MVNCQSLPVGTVELGDAGIRLSPNPTTGIVRFENLEAEWVAAFDQMGRLLRRFEQPAGSIDLSTMPAGVFFLKIFEKGKMYSARVVKQ